MKNEDEVETGENVVRQNYSNLDVLLCGVCKTAFHFLPDFQEHKVGGCRTMAMFRKHNISDNKPQNIALVSREKSQMKQTGSECDDQSLKPSTSEGSDED